ncbi:hypothetical protein G6F16_013171 [Rhizopus arrhizus]|nr:hypothetical protein G6F24_013547 [Rhizopus arrhizus]KAG0803671.1 hypothetical protein G6F20_013319 [Rhizopus arrhizus]KAG0847519.1 hypothetical protein G6F17_012459 [Rhizopus arrhizus]KAG0861576.1 hypothetical protein G6F16_013171 [Rhizopus arrhizus]KAG0900386.1 hypothetical protein G6F33_013109 [Rhizopus arrhizus]
MKRRLAWAKKYQNWTTDDWRRVVFSDETKVNVWGSDGCKYYWSRPGDSLKPHHINHDGDPKHRSKSIIQWLNANGVNYIDDWPAQSPDLNPIEHLWHHLKLKLSLYDKKAKGVHEL